MYVYDMYTLYRFPCIHSYIYLHAPAPYNRPKVPCFLVHLLLLRPCLLRSEAEFRECALPVSESGGGSESMGGSHEPGPSLYPQLEIYGP